MKDSSLRLQDKNILLVGPFNGITQAIIRTMTEYGADVGFVSDHQYAGKYVDGVNEAREVHPEYGRAANYAMPLTNEKQIQEALGRMTESLGRIDILVDATPLAWTTSTDVTTALNSSLSLAEKCIPFFLAKQRGRIVYLFDDASLDEIRPDKLPNGCREELMRSVQTLATKHRSQNVTVNALSIGVTDDFLLKVMPKSPSLKKSLEELQKNHTGIKLVEFHDVSLGTAYFSSALSSSVTGQVLRLTHGHHLI